MTWNKNSSAQNISITLIIIHKWEVINPFSIHGIHSISSKVMLSIATSGQLDKRWKKGNKMHQTPTSHFWSHCILISWHSWVNDQPIPVTQNTISNSMLYQYKLDLTIRSWNCVALRRRLGDKVISKGQVSLIKFSGYSESTTVRIWTSSSDYLTFWCIAFHKIKHFLHILAHLFTVKWTQT